MPVAVKRIEATARSPIYSHLTNALSGLPTIRCHHAEPRFISAMQGHLDHQRACTAHPSCNQQSMLDSYP